MGGMSALWGSPIAALFHLERRGGNLGRARVFVPMYGMSVPIGGPVVGELWLAMGKVVPPRGSRLLPL